jgi:hypothetical protein
MVFCGGARGDTIFESSNQTFARFARVPLNSRARSQIARRDFCARRAREDRSSLPSVHGPVTTEFVSLACFTHENRSEDVHRRYTPTPPSRLSDEARRRVRVRTVMRWRRHHRLRCAGRALSPALASRTTIANTEQRC